MKITKNKKIDYKLRLSQQEYQMLMFCIIYTIEDVREKERDNVMRPKDLSFHPENKEEIIVNTDEISKLRQTLEENYEET